MNFTGDSYDNTGSMSATNWRQVRFIERGSVLEGNMAWYMMSDSCKHCNQAGCLEVCPTHALMRTELGNVVVQQDVCNGCRACIPACPFGVIKLTTRQRVASTNAPCVMIASRKDSKQPAPKACPTDSIVYGDVDAMRVSARKRVDTLKSLGFNKAQLYGDTDILGGLNVFYLLLDEPEVYKQPRNPQLPQKNLIPGSLWSVGAAIALGVSALIAFRTRGARNDAAVKEN